MMLSDFSVSASSAWMFSSAPITFGKLIISPRPIMPSQVIISRISSARIAAPVSSNPATAGTQEGAFDMALSGERFASSIMIRTPSLPQTLQISCGSMKMPVVPQGTTAFAYSPTEIMDDSTWICPSIKPGAMYWPPASMTFVSGPMQCDASPTSAMRPSAIATSMPSWISAVQTLTRRAFLMTVSAFCTPMATRAIVRVTSYNGFLQNLFSMLVPPSSLQVRKSGRCSCAGI